MMTTPYKPEGPYVHPRSILSWMPSVTISEQQLRAILNGRNVHLPDLSDAKMVKAFFGQETLVAICERVAGPTFHPLKVLYNVNDLPELLKAAARPGA
jgi:hypothetical protein